MAEPLKTGAFTVSIVSHGQAELCARLLDDLARHSAASIGQLIITQNVPDSVPVTLDLPFPVEVIDNPRPQGFGENHNKAFRRATGDFFAVMNPDLRIPGDPFPALARCLADPTVGIAAPLVREASGTVADFARPLVSPWEVLRRRVDARVDPSQLARPDWIAGMFLAFRRQAYADLGGFDERYFLYCEDVDICARVRLRGLRLEMAGDASVTHLAQRESRRSLRYMWLHVSSLFRFWSSPVYRDYRALLRSEAAGLAGGR